MSDTQALSKKPTSLIRLDHASVMTTALEPAIAFYTDMLGLALRIIEDDPIRKGRRRAMLSDSNGTDVIEIIEMPELTHTAIPGRGGLHHLGFRLSQQDWRALRARLDASSHPYQEINDCLFLRDADGLVLELEQA